MNVGRFFFFSRFGCVGTRHDDPGVISSLTARVQNRISLFRLINNVPSGSGIDSRGPNSLFGWCLPQTPVIGAHL